MAKSTEELIAVALEEQSAIDEGLAVKALDHVIPNLNTVVWHTASASAFASAAKQVLAGAPWNPHETTASIAAWQLETFGQAKDLLSSYERAKKEFKELGILMESSPDDYKAVEEIADIVIVLSRIVAAHGADLQDAIDAKMAINRKREWVLTGDGHGQHKEKP